ncbi:hypothetical protein B0H66DRAFT_538058 [Apodospora peruviana]|uniref:Uncharacterized protein n=1 Tax=Apodospora peruviana TaxID=516989 RepID=A0AAE0HU74_9PEZI|nr:hypothetical protein B0H66DRAFT_538058 [Apodospora peruviana]
MRHDLDYPRSSTHDSRRNSSTRRSRSSDPYDRRHRHETDFDSHGTKVKETSLLLTAHGHIAHLQHQEHVDGEEHTQPTTILKGCFRYVVPDQESTSHASELSKRTQGNDQGKQITTSSRQSSTRLKRLASAPGIETSTSVEQTKPDRKREIQRQISQLTDQWSALGEPFQRQISQVTDQWLAMGQTFQQKISQLTGQWRHGALGEPCQLQISQLTDQWLAMGEPFQQQISKLTNRWLAVGHPFQQHISQLNAELRGLELEEELSTTLDRDNSDGNGADDEKSSKKDKDGCHYWMETDGRHFWQEKDGRLWFQEKDGSQWSPCPGSAETALSAPPTSEASTRIGTTHHDIPFMAWSKYEKASPIHAKISLRRSTEKFKTATPVEQPQGPSGQFSRHEAPSQPRPERPHDCYSDIASKNTSRSPSQLTVEHQGSRRDELGEARAHGSSSQDTATKKRFGISDRKKEEKQSPNHVSFSLKPTIEDRDNSDQKKDDKQSPNRVFFSLQPNLEDHGDPSKESDWYNKALRRIKVSGGYSPTTQRRPPRFAATVKDLDDSDWSDVKSQPRYHLKYDFKES